MEQIHFGVLKRSHLETGGKDISSAQYFAYTAFLIRRTPSPFLQHCRRYRHHSLESERSHFHTTQRDCVNPYRLVSVPFLFRFRRPSPRTSLGGNAKDERQWRKTSNFVNLQGGMLL